LSLAHSRGIARGRTQLKTAAFWVSTILGPTSLSSEVIGLLGSPEAPDGLRHLGYPAYFGVLLGASKLAGAVAITIPGLARVRNGNQAFEVSRQTARFLPV
jgi:hypothetical protein